MGLQLKCGIVGLPNVGKSTLFNALLKKRVALSANYPFATVEPNIGVVAVSDERLGKLGELVKNEEHMDSLPPLVPAVVEFVDIAGLVKGASVGEGLGNQFLSHIREVDAIVHVLRDFTDENVVRAGSENPEADKATIETELILADLQVIDKLIENAKNEEKKGTTSRYSMPLSPILERMKAHLNVGKPLNNFYMGEEKLQEWFSNLPLLTIKLVLYVYNVSEANITKRSANVGESEINSEILRFAQDDNAIVISAKLEEELADLPEEERKDYLKELGVEETGLERLIKKAYLFLGLISFLTAGKKEIRAWTIKDGWKAPQAAGVIHSDFEKNFIRAEVVEYEKLIEAGSFADAKKRGWIRTEGKDYPIKDGDVVEFLVSS